MPECSQHTAWREFGIKPMCEVRAPLYGLDLLSVEKDDCIGAHIVVEMNIVAAHAGAINNGPDLPRMDQALCDDPYPLPNLNQLHDPHPQSL